MVDAPNALLQGIVQLTVEIRFGVVVAWRTVIVLVTAATHGVLSVHWHVMSSRPSLALAPNNIHLLLQERAK